MAVQAAIDLFRQATVLQYEQSVSKLRGITTKETMSQGLTSTFLVNGSAGDTAVTRGANGDIPYGGPTNTQVTLTLVERHAAKELTGFDVFASQGDQAGAQGLRRQVMNIINRDIDLTILAALASATQDYGTGVMDLDTIAGAKTILGNADVPTEEVENMFGIISPAAEAYMMQISEFASADYVSMKPFENAKPVDYKRWYGINWIVSNKVTGVGTSAEILYILHRASLGHVANMGEENVTAGFEEKHARSWARATIYHAAGILQNTGIVKITHDGSAFVAT